MQSDSRQAAKFAHDATIHAGATMVAVKSIRGVVGKFSRFLRVHPLPHTIAHVAMSPLVYALSLPMLPAWCAW